MKATGIILITLLVLTIFLSLSSSSNHTHLFAQDNTVNTKTEKQAEPANPSDENTASDTENTVAGNQELPNGEPTDPVETEGSTLFSTVKQGGPLMIFIMLLGMVALTIIIERFIYFTKNKIWKGETLNDFFNEYAENSDHKYKEDLEDTLRNAFHIYSNGMEKGLALLSGIGNIAPIVGFLGTVIGMISAFAAIAAATTVNAKVVAVGIQIALVTTAGGLTIAAPTLAFYYLFTHIIQNRYSDSEKLIEELSEKMPRLSAMAGKGKK